MKFSVPETKRAMFHIIKNYVDLNLNLPLFKSRDRVIGVSGPRHCGKTTLLQQLANHYGDLVFYKNFTEHEEYTTLYSDVINSGKTIVIIDEICKASNTTQIQFCTDARNLQNASKFVIFTGSVTEVLDSISDFIGRGGLFDLGIISYFEWLCWENDIDTNLNSELAVYTRLSNNQNFIDYLYYLDIEGKQKNYITAVISDTCISISNRYRMQFQVNERDLLIVIKYLAVKEIFSSLEDFPDIKNYGEIESAVNNEIQSINENFKNLNINAREDCVKLLLSSGLLKELYSNIDSNTKTYVFAYPWAFTEFLGKVLEDSIKPIEDIWVEASLLNAISEIYFDCCKYRKTDGSAEVDIIYSSNLYDIYAIEVKNSRLSNASKKSKRANALANEFNIKEFVFTNTEDTNLSTDTEKYISNDTLLLYMNIYSLIINSYRWLSNDSKLRLDTVYGIRKVEEELLKILPLSLNSTTTGLFS